MKTQKEPIWFLLEPSGSTALFFLPVAAGKFGREVFPIRTENTEGVFVARGPTFRNVARRSYRRGRI